MKEAASVKAGLEEQLRSTEEVLAKANTSITHLVAERGALLLEVQVSSKQTHASPSAI